MRRLIPILAFMVITLGVYFVLNRTDGDIEMVVVEVPEVRFEEVAEVVEGTEELKNLETKEPDNQVIKQSENSIPTSFNLAIPWTSQAPHAVWDERDQDACEEASIYMAHLYFQGVDSGLVNPYTADQAIQDLVDTEMQMFGFFESTTAEQVVELIESYYGYTTELIQDPTVDQIKEVVLAGNPVVVPMAGQVLANPFFTPPGPEYHMLVVKGFTEDGFITNDPGTKRGENWLYEYDHFMNSIHDYVEGDMLSGKKVVIVIKK